MAVFPQPSKTKAYESPIKMTDNPSTEPVDEEYVKFQSAEKSAGTTTNRNLQFGLNNIQEQPHRFAKNRNTSPKEENKERNITKEHFETLKDKYHNQVEGKN